MASRKRRYAAIDIGTNSIHLLVAERARRGFRVCDHEKEMVQLGRGSLGGHPLTDEGMERGVAAIAQMADIARKSGAKEIVAVATSAVREAPNAREFLAAVKRQSGIDVRVISGEEEADYIFRAVRLSVDLAGGSALCIDIGGGSTEFVLGTGDEIFYTRSEPLGSLRLTQSFLHDDPPAPQSLETLARFVRKRVRKAVQPAISIGFDQVVATSGTAVAIAELISRRDPEHGSADALRKVSLSEVRELTALLAPLSTKERAEKYGLEPRRAETVVAGAIVLAEFLSASGAGSCLVASTAMREGIIDSILAHTQTEAEATPGARRSSVLDLAERSGYDAAHAEQVRKLSVRLFDQLLPVHKLKARDRDLLESAALLHEIGMHVSYPGYHKHTYYLIRHGDLRGFTEDEVAVLANVARYHRKAPPDAKHPNFQELTPAEQQRVRKLAALLRVADALDRGRKQVVRDVRVEIDDGRVRLLLRPRGEAATEMRAAQKRSRPFARLLDVEVEIELESHRATARRSTRED